MFIFKIESATASVSSTQSILRCVHVLFRVFSQSYVYPPFVCLFIYVYNYNEVSFGNPRKNVRKLYPVCQYYCSVSGTLWIVEEHVQGAVKKFTCFEILVQTRWWPLVTHGRRFGVPLFVYSYNWRVFTVFSFRACQHKPQLLFLEQFVSCRRLGRGVWKVCFSFSPHPNYTV